MSKPFNLYFILTRRGRHILVSTPEELEAVESQSVHRIRQFIDWLTAQPNRLVAWLGRAFAAAYRYYLKLEDRIDPSERVLKAMALADSVAVHFVSAGIVGEQQIASDFERVLKRSRWKHIVWLLIDSVAAGVVALLSPFLVPIPGPNVFFYYPVLRLLSHYRAFRGAVSGLRSGRIEFKSLPGRRALEDNPSLTRFLERMDA